MYILEHHIIVSVCSLVIFLVGMWTGVDRIVLGGKEISLEILIYIPFLSFNFPCSLLASSSPAITIFLQQ